MPTTSPTNDQRNRLTLPLVVRARDPESRSRAYAVCVRAQGCWNEIPLPATARFVAAGDHDGNGRDDVAWSDGATTTRVLLSD
jgi:hypothetical protein